jgi:exodeoxyribonuclease VII large subunit
MSQTELSFRPQQPPRSGPPTMTVAQLVRTAHAALDAKFGVVWVEGEVSNLRVGGGGHAYFTLKDDDAALPVAMWKSSVERLRFRLADGQKLRVCGRVGIFAKQGRFQLYADRAEPAGLGALMLELEQRKQRLAAEGLFDPARKRPLPAWPRTVGIVTSQHGAALHDILEVARRRCPMHLVLAPALVQGPEAPSSLARALVRLSKRGGIDVIILGRGGGSIEDLWAFNDERLARVIAACRVPVVSAVGHEVDVTICDLVADVRAATPSQAAELVVPDCRAWIQALRAADDRLRRAMKRREVDAAARLDQSRVRLHAIGRALVVGPRRALQTSEHALALLHPRARVARDRRALAELASRLRTAAARLVPAAQLRLRQLVARMRARGQTIPVLARGRLARLQRALFERGHAIPGPARLRLARAAGALDALSPLAVLQRGYAVVTDEAGAVVTDARGLAVGSTIQARLRRGTLHATVTAKHHEPEGDGDREPD